MDKRWFKSSGWLWLSLLVPLYFGLVSLAYSFSQPYLIQDDARLHIVWLQQWVDPALFPNDPIAHYYRTIQAAGFQAIYWIFAQAGIAPLLLAKLLPLLLAMVTTVYLFRLSQLLLPHPACGFLTTLLLNQNIWIKDDLISATPRAFVYPLFAAFLYYLLCRSLLPTLISLGLMGLFYPQMVLVELGILTLRLWRGGWSQRRADYALLLAGLAIALLVILPFQQQVSHEFGALQSAVQMQQMPEFGPSGRRAYFGVPPLQFWFAGASGLRFPLFPPILWAGLALPLLLRTRFPAVQQITSEVRVLAEIGLSAIGWFLLAHLLFPRLYLPSRYTFYSLRVLMALAAGIVLFVAIETWVLPLFGAAQRGFRQSVLRLGVLSLLLAVAIIPAIPPLFLDGQGWISGQQPAVYQFFAAQPRSIRIGSLSREADNLPAFSQRSVWVSRELALAYHPRFYQLMQQRMVDLLKIHYSSDLATVQTQLQQTQLDYLLIDRQFANPDFLLQQDWLFHSSIQSTVQDFVNDLKQGSVPALTQVLDRCTVLHEDDLIILETRCIAEGKS